MPVMATKLTNIVMSGLRMGPSVAGTNGHEVGGRRHRRLHPQVVVREIVELVLRSLAQDGVAIALRLEVDVALATALRVLDGRADVDRDFSAPHHSVHAVHDLTVSLTHDDERSSRYVGNS